MIRYIFQFLILSFNSNFPLTFYQLGGYWTHIFSIFFPNQSLTFRQEYFAPIV